MTGVTAVHWENASGPKQRYLRFSTAYKPMRSWETTTSDGTYLGPPFNASRTSADVTVSADPSTTGGRKYLGHLISRAGVPGTRKLTVSTGAGGSAGAGGGLVGATGCAEALSATRCDLRATVCCSGLARMPLTRSLRLRAWCWTVEDAFVFFRGAGMAEERRGKTSLRCRMAEKLADDHRLYTHPMQ